MNNMNTPAPAQSGYNQVLSSRMGMGLGGMGNMGGYGGGNGMPFNVSGSGGQMAGLGGYGGYGGMGGFGFNPMMGGFGNYGFNPMMMGGFGGYGGMGGFNPMMAMGLGAFGGFGGYGFNPMMMGGFGGYGGYQSPQPTNEFYQQGPQPIPSQNDGGTMYAGGTPGFYDNPMMGGYGGFDGRYGGFNQQPQPQMAERYNPNVYDPRADAQRNMQQQAYEREANTTDYQRLMQRKNSASAGPYVNPLTGAVGGVNPFTQVSDVEIAASLGWKNPIADPNRMTDMAVRSRLPGQEEAERTANNAKAKAYLDSIGYGQSGFDPSKYEVRRERSPSVGFSGFGGLFSGLR